MIDQRTMSGYAAAGACVCANTGATAPPASTNATVRTERLLTTSTLLNE
jgi:hypothetical protein